MRTPLPDAFLRLPLCHRGFHSRKDRRPENTRAAFQAAIKAGYGIELDLQLSLDGVPMVFHDAGLFRLTGRKGRVRAKTAKELGQIKLKDSDEGIPTLAEILKLVAGQVPLLIEMKDQSGVMGATDGLLERATAGVLAGYRGAVALMSFNPHMVAEMSRLAPEVPRGLTTSAYVAADWPELDQATCDRLRAIPDYDRAECSFISHEAPDLARQRVGDLKTKGAAILCWTIKSPAQEEAARRYADNITFERYPAPFVRS